MASGWAPDGAELEQIEATIEDGVAQIRARLRQGESAEFCRDCGEEIPFARREALPGVQFCVACQELRDQDEKFFQAYNRRGSKDSQLR